MELKMKKTHSRTKAMGMGLFSWSAEWIGWSRYRAAVV